MVMDSKLLNTNRLLLEVDLEPVQGSRFQPTGFPNLGAATFTTPGGRDMLLVESNQSMANRMEAVCWDTPAGDLVPELHGLPYVLVKGADGGILTNSILESHRLNSPYILEGADRSFLDALKSETGTMDFGAVNLREVARVVFKYDPNTLLHGIFFAKKDLAGGRLRLQRLLSGFIEASDVRPVESGGVKMDSVNPSGDTSKGFGHVPFHRTEYTAGRVTAYFNLDLASLRGYRLSQEASDLLVTLAMWKIRRFLSAGLRLRTAADFEPGALAVKRPQGFAMPEEGELSTTLARQITKCAAAGVFANPAVTVVNYQEVKQSKAKPVESDEEF